MGKVWGSLREREVIITKGSQSIITDAIESRKSCTSLLLRKIKVNTRRNS